MATNLILNGDFESTNLAIGDFYSNFAGFALPGWTFPTGPNTLFVESGVIFGFARYESGHQAVCLNYDGAGTSQTPLSQSFATVVGQDYVLSFALSEEQLLSQNQFVSRFNFTSPTVVSVKVAGAAGSVLATDIHLAGAAPAGFTVTDSPLYPTQYRDYTVHFVATSTQTTLSFWDSTPGTPSIFDSAFLDNVSVVAAVNQTPTLDPIVPPGAVVEALDAHAQDIAAIAGVLSVSDLDKGNVLTAVAAAPVVQLNGIAFTLPAGALAMIDPNALHLNGPIVADGTSQSIGWTYDPAAADLDFLRQGDTLTLTYAITVSDGQASSGPQNLVLTVTGTNDPAAISGQLTGAVVEDGGDANKTKGTPSASGVVTVTDPDSGENQFKAVPGTALQGTYGTFTFNPGGGQWSYSLDEAKADPLVAGQHVTDKLTVASADGTATKDIVVDITGVNDNASIGGLDTGSVVEDGGVNNADRGQPSAFGRLTITDADAGEDHFQGAVNTLLVGTYGNFTFNAATGDWTYTLDQARADTLAEGQAAKDHLVVLSADGTATQNIDIDIAGANDAPTVAGAVALGAVSTTAPITITEAQLLANVHDVDQGAVLHVDATAVAPGSVAGLSVSPGAGTLVSAGVGVWTFTPSATFAGTATFGYGVTDGIVTAATADTATLTIATGQHIVVRPGDVRVDGGAGNDVFLLGQGGPFQFRIIDGHGGTDTLDLSATTAGNTVQLGDGLAFGPQIGLNFLRSIENAIGGSGNDTFIFSGNHAVNVASGGTGDDRFVFLRGFGHDRIVSPTGGADFQVGTAAHHDTLDLRDLGFASVGDVLNHTDGLGTNSVIRAGADDITLVGVTKAQLESHPFDILV